MTLNLFLAVAAGGLIGAPARYLLDRAITSPHVQKTGLALAGFYGLDVVKSALGIDLFRRGGLHLPIPPGLRRRRRRRGVEGLPRR